jgi:hypothetical protein
MSLVCIIPVPIYRDAGQEKTCSPGPAQIPVPISRRMSYNTYTYRVLGWPAQHSACSVLGQHCHTALPNTAADLDPDLIRPLSLSGWMDGCCTTHLSRAQTAPYHTTQHGTALHCRAHDTLRAKLPHTHSTLDTLLHSALCSGPAVFHIPITVSGTEPPLPSP